MKNHLDLSGKKAIITGASRGIGLATLKLFAEQGCYVIGTGTNKNSVQTIQDALKSVNGKGEGCILNTLEPDTQKQFIQHIETQHKDINILVNNAGITRDSLFFRMKEDDWNAVIQSNLSSIFTLCQKISYLMFRNKTPGRIINVSSVVGSMGNVGQVNYSASKAGLFGLTKSIAQEVGSRNICINCIAPGFVKTDMLDAVDEKLISTSLEKSICLKRAAQPKEIAGSILFLTSPLASYITGSVLDVNGGLKLL